MGNPSYDVSGGHDMVFARQVDASGNALGQNANSTIATLTAASASGNSVDLNNPGGSGLILAIDITAITGTTPSITVTVQGKDAASGKYYTVLASAALSTVSTTILRVFAGATAAANTAANDKLPCTWRVSWVIAGTTPAVTATIGACITS